MKVIAIGPLYNEGRKAIDTVRKFPKNIVDEVVVVNDASTDGAAQEVAKTGITVLSMPSRTGPGPAIRRGVEYGLKKGADVFVIFATNGKDDPVQIPRLLEPVREGRADFVQGSRFLPGGGWEHTPFYRVSGIKIFSLLFSIMIGRKITDGTNGFRAIRRSLFEDKRINLYQDWLEGYPLETYLFVQAIRFGYKVVEVPVNKIYPVSRKNYSKMRPWVDWWNYFKPVPLVTLGIKK